MSICSMRLSCVGVLCAVLIGCGGGGGGNPPQPPPPTQPQSQTLSFAQAGPLQLVLSSTATNAATAVGTGAVSYASTNPSVVIVDGSGVASAVGVGSATITATKAADASYLQAQASYSVNVQTANTLNAWIGSNGSQVFMPQSANGKQFGRARVADCSVSNTVATCAQAELSAITSATFEVADSRAALTTQAYYALVDNQLVGPPIVASAARFSVQQRDLGDP